MKGYPLSVFANHFPVPNLSHFDEESLFSNFQEHFPVKNTKSPRNLWRIFAKSIISICEFLTQFEDAKAFDDFVLTFTKNEITRAALPMVLEKEVYGYGFALSCDFLKELGYTQYPKPDDHLMDVFSGVKICERDPYTVYKSTIRMAQACGRTAYYVDKTIWLICSGNYYLDDIALQRYAFLGAGYKIRKSILMHVNNQYVRSGDLNLNDFFTLNDCTDEVVNKLDEVKDNLSRLYKILKKETEPDVDPGDHCYDPFECEFCHHCWPKKSEHSVYDIFRSGTKLCNLINAPYVSG